MEKRLIFSDISEAKAILGMKDEFLKTLQREFPACRIAARGNEIIMAGEDPDISYAEGVLNMLRYLYRENTYLTTQHVLLFGFAHPPGKSRRIAENLQRYDQHFCPGTSY
jgi:phosphate starvation-inducible PhoH-like protein